MYVHVIKKNEKQRKNAMSTREGTKNSVGYAAVAVVL